MRVRRPPSAADSRLRNTRTRCDPVARPSRSSHASRTGSQSARLRKSCAPKTTAARISSARRAPPPGGGARLADEILAAVVFGAQDFLNRADWEPVLDAWLERLGRATGSHRVRVFRNLESAADGGLRTRITAEWRAPEVADLAAMRLEELTYSQCGCDRWPAVLAKGEQIVGSTADFAECEREFLRAQGIESVAIVPVFVRAEW